MMVLTEDINYVLIYRWCFTDEYSEGFLPEGSDCNTFEIIVSFSQASARIGRSLKLDRENRRMTINELWELAVVNTDLASLCQISNCPLCDKGKV